MSRSIAFAAGPRAYGPLPGAIKALTAALALVLIVAVPAMPRAAVAAEPITILGFGDSLMAGYGLDNGSSFPAQLEAALARRGHDVKLVNAGVSGDTTAGGKARLGWSLAEKPDAAIVELGANDGLRGLPVEQMRKNLDAILSELEKQGVPTLLAGMRAPPNMGREYGEAFERAFTEVAEAHDVVYYPFFLDGVAANAALNQHDGLHPTAEGVALIVERILPKVEALLERVKAKRGA